MSINKTWWPCFSRSLPYEVAVTGGSYPGLVVPSPFTNWYSPVVESVASKENRKFFLDRSVFDLVEPHHHLSLSDHKLMLWYLNLSQEDRTIIDGEGGFHHFLFRHPALELTQHHVYVNYNKGSSRSKTTAGGAMYRCETHDHVERRHGDMMDNKSSKSHGDKHQDQQRAQHRFSENRSSWQLDSSISSTAAAYKDPMVPGGFCLDVDLEPRRRSTRDRWSESCSVVLQVDGLSPDQNGCDVTDGSVFYSIMEDNGSIVALATEEQTDTRDITKTMASSNCDVMVSTDPPAPLVSVWTQCDDPPTCDRHINTEVLMTDLDYLAEEFMKTKSTLEELRREKEKTTRRVCRAKEACEHQQRAQRAELSLLSLQLNMCRIHCWRRIYDSAEGERAAAQCRSELPPNVSVVLQKLDSDFAEMKDQILEGVPLEQLGPLTVVSEAITTGGPYVPAQILSDLMTRPASRFTRAQTQTSGGGGASGQETKQQVKTDKAKRSVCRVPQDKGAAAARDLNLNEAWFDAEEDLGPQEDLDQIQDQASASATKLKPSRSESCSSDKKSSSERVSGATRRTEVSVAPTATGTCVAHHYGTMGSFDALMSQLTRLHPHVDRQTIVNAMMELKVQYGAALTRLPLTTVTDMTSQLLRAEDATPL